MKHILKEILSFVLITTLFIGFQSCSDFEKYELPEAGSIPDATPPSALFEATQGEGAEFLTYSFSNLSTSATNYLWDFGDGNMSMELDAVNTFPDEGTYTVSLTASDDLGAISTYTQSIEVIEPEAPEVPNPTLVNADFDKLAKLNASDCNCSGWDNDDIGEQGESSSGNGGSDNVLKFDNNEPDHIYQEFEVVPNVDYTITVVTSFKSLINNTPPMPSSLEIRVLSGNGYESGYTPTYYETAPEFPSSGYGYTSITQVEEAANNLLTETLTNPENDDYFTDVFTFNSGANTSVALFMRGIGGEATGEYGYTSGDEEIRIDSVSITAN
ncbi:PKD domain-containing protein [Bizionia sp. KMM 8389]